MATVGKRKLMVKAAPLNFMAIGKMVKSMAMARKLALKRRFIRCGKIIKLMDQL
jgi:hypothetical protein